MREKKEKKKGCRAQKKKIKERKRERKRKRKEGIQMVPLGFYPGGHLRRGEEGMVPCG